MVAPVPNPSAAVGMIEDDDHGHDPDSCFDEVVGRPVRTRRTAGVGSGVEPVSDVGGDNVSRDRENVVLASADREENRVLGDHG
jgi:hypothetical protein